jgi:exodeoxyribonuclease X
MKMNAIIFDTESTGLKDAQLIEAAWVGFDLSDPGSGKTFYQRYRATCDMEYGAMATHNILPGDLLDCPSPDTFALPDVDYLIGHNIDFDWKMVGSPDVRRICTLALSRWLFPEVDSHKQSAMLYFAYGYEARGWLVNAHNALVDVMNCRRLLDFLLLTLRDRGYGFGSLADLWGLSEYARVPVLMPFGKHKGEPIAEVPDSYIAWYLKQADSDADPYLVRALRGKLDG